MIHIIILIYVLYRGRRRLGVRRSMFLHNYAEPVCVRSNFPFFSLFLFLTVAIDRGTGGAAQARQGRATGQGLNI
jgi:hypothetical protein